MSEEAESPTIPEDAEVHPSAIEAVLLATCPVYRRCTILKHFNAYDDPAAKVVEKLELIDQWAVNGVPPKPVRNLKPVP